MKVKMPQRAARFTDIQPLQGFLLTYLLTHTRSYDPALLVVPLFASWAWYYSWKISKNISMIAVLLTETEEDVRKDRIRKRYGQQIEGENESDCSVDYAK